MISIMPRVFIPPLLRTLTNGCEIVEVAGQNVAEAVDSLERQFPGFRERLVDGERLKPGLSVAVGTKMCARGLLTKVASDDEIHFLPAIGGG